MFLSASILFGSLCYLSQLYCYCFTAFCFPRHLSPFSLLLSFRFHYLVFVVIVSSGGFSFYPSFSSAIIMLGSFSASSTAAEDRTLYSVQVSLTICGKRFHLDAYRFLFMCYSEGSRFLTDRQFIEKQLTVACTWDWRLKHWANKGAIGTRFFG